jgi:hypothetical protein
MCQLNFYIGIKKNFNNMYFYLSQVKRKGLPRRMIIFDTETIEENINDNESQHKLFLGIAVYYERRSNGKDTEVWFEFKTKDEFWNFVIDHCYKKSVLNIVSHNISFDFRVVDGFNELKKRGFILYKFLSNNWVNIWKFRKDDTKIIVFDSMNYFNVSLYELGKSIGLDKLEMPKDYENIDNWKIYCKRDVEILLYAFKQLFLFINENNLGYFGYTLASQSLISYRKNFLNTKIFFKRSDYIVNFERNAYYGGRVECFRIGYFNGDNYYYLDVNSLYPYVMKNTYLPIRLIGIYDNVDIKLLERFIDKYCLIAKVRIKTDFPLYPYRLNKKLIFPVGEFTTYLCTPEIKLGLERNNIISIDEVFVYLRDKIFDKFVNYFYQKRLEEKEKGNLTKSFFYKIILNSLYGKFGQRNDKWEFICIDENHPDGSWIVYDIDEDKRYLYRCINGIIERSVGKIEAKYSFPAIPAHITSAGRVRLNELISKAGFENVFYVDTDSLFVNEKGFQNLKDEIDNKEIGKLKLVKKSNNVIIYGLKDYQFADDVKIKGIRKNAIKINDRVFVQVQFEGIKSGLRKSNLDKVIMRKVVKVLKRNYNKGIVLPDGKVIPFTLCE